METVRNDREWFRRISGGKSSGKKDNSKRICSAQVGGGSVNPAVKKAHGFDDIAGMEELKRLVIEGFINVLNNRECAEAFGIVPPSILLYGPSGCGKTYFAEAIASEIGATFIKVVPDDIACKWVHGTQEKIGEIFHKAERNSPAILFFDEFDAMVPHRTEEDNHNQNGEVNEFLCMMNNASEKGVYIIAATNHPEVIDKAVLRAGRIDEMIYVDMPDKASRESLFRLSLSKLPSDANIDFGRLADLTQGYNCSDISYIVKLASRKMFNASIAERDQPYKIITQMHLEDAIACKSPSVSAKELAEYERIHSQFAPKDSRVKMRRIGY